MGIAAVNTFFETKPCACHARVDRADGADERCGVLWTSTSSEGSASATSHTWASSPSASSTAPSSAAPSPTKATRSSGGFACDRDGNSLFDRDLPPLPVSATRRVSEADAAFAAPVLKSPTRPGLNRGRSHTLGHTSLDSRIRARSSSLAAMANELAPAPVPPLPQRALPPTPRS